MTAAHGRWRIGGLNHPTNVPSSRFYISKPNSPGRASTEEFPSPITSSETAYSDERLIYNAFRVSTSNNEEPCNRARMAAVMEEGMAANMAMFVPEGSSEDLSPNQPPPTIERYRHILSDRPQQHELGLMNDRFQHKHRKTMSLDTTQKNGQTPRWLGNTVPAIVTAEPPFPPPARMPTPPGLPSFNTPEAMEYSARFLASPSTASPCERAAMSGKRTSPCSIAFRKLLGLPPSDKPGPSPLSVTGIGRAADGTIVQGRFPYRQSGHGMNVAREIDDHPFHRDLLPAARLNVEDALGEAAHAKDPQNIPKRRTNAFVFPSPDRPSFGSAQRTYNREPRSQRQSRSPLALLGISQHATPRSDSSIASVQITSARAVGLSTYSRRRNMALVRSAASNSQQQSTQGHQAPAQGLNTNSGAVSGKKQPVRAFFRWVSRVLCCGSVRP